jgi:hypothetical protein
VLPHAMTKVRRAGASKRKLIIADGSRAGNRAQLGDCTPRRQHSNQRSAPEFRCPERMDRVLSLTVGVTPPATHGRAWGSKRGVVDASVPVCGLKPGSASEGKRLEHLTARQALVRVPLERASEQASKRAVSGCGTERLRSRMAHSEKRPARMLARSALPPSLDSRRTLLIV